MRIPSMQKFIVPAIVLAAGLLIGLGLGHIQITKERKISQDKIKEANRKTAYFQQKMEEEKSAAMASLEQKEQQCRGDLGKLQAALRTEKKNLGAQVEKLQAQTQKLEQKARETDAAFARTKQELQTAERSNKELDRELKKTTEERTALQAEHKKTVRDLGQCVSDNAGLCVLAEELVSKYKNKGLGSVLLEKEPLTQVKKVEMEQMAQKYREEIEQMKNKKNIVEGKHVEE